MVIIWLLWSTVSLGLNIGTSRATRASGFWSCRDQLGADEAVQVFWCMELMVLEWQLSLSNQMPGSQQFESFFFVDKRQHQWCSFIWNKVHAVDLAHVGLEVKSELEDQRREVDVDVT